MPAKTERNNAIAADIVAGLFPDEITQKHGISYHVLCNIAWQKGLRVKSRHRERGKALREAIRLGYAANNPPQIIAAELGINVVTVRTQACKMGLTKGRNDPAMHRRGFPIPPELRERWRELRKLGLTTQEAGVELGLLPRNL